MKHMYLFILVFLILMSTCKKTNRDSNDTLSIRDENDLTEENMELSINNNNEVVVSSINQNATSIFRDDHGEKSIQYISWENVVKFIDYKAIAWLIFDRMTGDGDYYFGTYTLDIQDNITFLNVHFDDRNDERWLILANGTLCDIFKSGSRIPGIFIHGVTGSVNRTENIYFYGPVSASSYLTENGISYPSDNLSIHHWTDTPWVEGDDGYGINEKLFFENLFIQNGSMHISIGYVSYDKPYLYNQNSRPKTIKLSVENRFSFEVELRDTPHYQEISFPSVISKDDILVLEILDVYNGTKYEDTCINSIYFEVYKSGYYEINDYWDGQPDW